MGYGFQAFWFGKSPFEVLPIILVGRIVKGNKAVDYFDDKIDDPLLLAEMKRADQFLVTLSYLTLIPRVTPIAK